MNLYGGNSHRSQAQCCVAKFTCVTSHTTFVSPNAAINYDSLCYYTIKGNCHSHIKALLLIGRCHTKFLEFSCCHHTDSYSTGLDLGLWTWKDVYCSKLSLASEAVPANLTIQAGSGLMLTMPLSPPSRTHPAYCMNLYGGNSRFPRI